MQGGGVPSEMEAAVQELQAYFSDSVPPLLVVDSVDLLIGHPPRFGVDAIRAWMAVQMRWQATALPAADYLFHAVKKIQFLGDLRLIAKDRLQAYVDGLIEALVSQEPPAERQALIAHLRRAGEFVGEGPSSAAGILRMETLTAGGATDEAGAPISHDMARNMRAFSVLLSRLGGAPSSDGTSAAGVRRTELAPQLLAAAAQSARTQRELDQYLASLSKAGLVSEVSVPQLFSTLSHGLPNWRLAVETDGPVYESPPIQAMRRIVTLAEEPGKAVAHFRELLKTVAQQVNRGALARAIQVLDVAVRLVEEKKVDPLSAALIFGSTHEELDTSALLAQTKKPANLPLLRRLLDAFPALQPEGLLRSLDNEPDRSRRRLWLALLEVHGVPARWAALERLEASFSGGEPTERLAWLQRNFVYLLHRIPPAPGEDLQREVALSIRCADLKNPAALVREALVNLGLRRHPDGEAALRQRLGQLERWLEAPLGAPHEHVELVRMLGLVISALARYGTPGARRAVVEHGLKQKRHLGDTLERLGELGTVDLAEDPELVGRLLRTLRDQLPKRLLGMSLGRSDGLVHVVRALQATRSDAVRQTFTDLASRFPDEPFGHLAAVALAGWEGAPALKQEAASSTSVAAATPAVGLSGDLEVFGLPELLQTLTQVRASGRLVLRNRLGEAIGEIVLHNGAVGATHVGRLSLPDAFYQLLEEPQPGTFEFARLSGQAVPAETSRDLMGLLLEGMRRYDELARARALVPDDAALRPTGSRPTPPPEEADGAFIRDLWTRVKAGATPRQCEEAVAADAYRVRALLFHWLTEGAVEIRAPA